MIAALLAAGMAGGGGFAPAFGRDVLDRVVASVDSTAITQNDVEIAYGFELFLEGQMPKPAPDQATLDAVRDRQIDQLLLSREADLENLSETDGARAATDWLQNTRQKFRSEQDFQAALRALGMDEAAVLARLSERQRILTLTDRRLRPSARVEPPDIEDYYKKTFLPELAKKSSQPAPPLAEVEDQIREILTQKKINELLGSWLENLKTNHRVTVHALNEGSKPNSRG